MKDQLISFETAKLARESGFDEECGLNYAQDGEVQTLQYWEGNGNGFESNSEIDCDFYIENNPVCSAPTQSLLQRWLREIHNLQCYSECNASGWIGVIENTNGTFIKELGQGGNIPEAGMWETYEEALEEGLYETLKLIK